MLVAKDALEVPGEQDESIDPQWPIPQLMSRLRTSPGGLTSREAARRLVTDGLNEIVRRGCQMGTAFAARAERASLRSIGIFSNRPLLAAIVFEVAFALTIAYTPQLHRIFGTAGITGRQLLLVAPFPFIVWVADEVRRLLVRHHSGKTDAGSSESSSGSGAPPPLVGVALR